MVKISNTYFGYFLLQSLHALEKRTIAEYKECNAFQIHVDVCQKRSFPDLSSLSDFCLVQKRMKI